ncbi:HIT family protein [Hahella ganghwensis]|uniref:HIT family protein n=1 Tax=Hahella ganghwensis TaxID=286420 RepID=UPI00036946D1|nr:HIT family protein [Hahella ganghwensis]
MSDCLFCAIAADQEPSTCVYEDDDCKVFLDIYPVSRGHMLIIPKAHHVTFDEVSDELRNRLSRVTHLMSRVVMTSELGAQGYNIQVNNGTAANQHVPHLHIHVIPRYKGDVLKVMGHFLLQAPGIFIGKRKHASLTPIADIIKNGVIHAEKTATETPG